MMQPQNGIIKDKDGKLYSIIDLLQGNKTPLDPQTLEISMQPANAIIVDKDSKLYSLVELIGSSSGGGDLTEIETRLLSLEENKVDNATFQPVANVATWQEPIWAPETEYKSGDIIFVRTKSGDLRQARCLKDFTSAKNVGSVPWSADLALKNLEVMPTITSKVGGPAYDMMTFETLDKWEIENYLNNAYVKIGELNNLQTTAKDNLVNAINEVKNSASSGGSSSSSNWQSNGENTFLKDYDLQGSENYAVVGIGAGLQSNYGNNSLLVGQGHSVYNFRNGIICGESSSTEAQDGNGNEYRFKIGDGSGQDAFNVTYMGDVYAKGSVTSSGADYAEMFEWLDGNIKDENIKQMFVSLNKNKIQIAKSENEYIIGIISTKPSIIGNNIEERSTQKEWGVVGLLGQLEVKDNGKCIPGEMCTVENGIAIPGNKYYVMERLEDNLIKVLFK